MVQDVVWLGYIVCSPDSFEEGFLAIAEFIDNLICDAPKTLELFAIVLKGAGLDENRRSNIVGKSSENRDRLPDSLDSLAFTLYQSSSLPPGPIFTNP